MFWLQKAAEKDPTAQYRLANKYYNGAGVTKDLAKAVELYRKAADGGFAEAQRALAYLYENGDGVPKDLTQAFKWYKAAAENGLALAQFKTGYFYWEGTGVAQDYAQAVQWLRKAAEQKNSDAAFLVGMACHDGLGVQKDLPEALRWFKVAADQEMVEAEFMVGLMYANGEGTPKDMAAALPWLRKAADKNLAVAQRVLGEILTFAIGGVSEDRVQGLPLLKKAADQGDETAKKDLETALTPPPEPPKRPVAHCERVLYGSAEPGCWGDTAFHDDFKAEFKVRIERTHRENSTEVNGWIGEFTDVRRQDNGQHLLFKCGWWAEEKKEETHCRDLQVGKTYVVRAAKGYGYVFVYQPVGGQMSWVETTCDSDKSDFCGP